MPAAARKLLACDRMFASNKGEGGGSRMVGGRDGGFETPRRYEIIANEGAMAGCFLPDWEWGSCGKRDFTILSANIDSVSLLMSRGKIRLNRGDLREIDVRSLISYCLC